MLTITPELWNSLLKLTNFNHVGHIFWHIDTGLDFLHIFRVIIDDIKNSFDELLFLGTIKLIIGIFYDFHEFLGFWYLEEYSIFLWFILKRMDENILKVCQALNFIEIHLPIHYSYLMTLIHMA